MRFSRHGVNTDFPNRKVATWIGWACVSKPSQCPFTFIDLCFAAFTFKFFDELTQLRTLVVLRVSE